MIPTFFGISVCFTQSRQQFADPNFLFHKVSPKLACISIKQVLIVIDILQDTSELLFTPFVQHLTNNINNTQIKATTHKIGIVIVYYYT